MEPQESYSITPREENSSCRCSGPILNWSKHTNMILIGLFPVPLQRMPAFRIQMCQSKTWRRGQTRLLRDIDKDGFPETISLFMIPGTISLMFFDATSSMPFLGLPSLALCSSAWLTIRFVSKRRRILEAIEAFRALLCVSVSGACTERSRMCG